VGWLCIVADAADLVADPRRWALTVAAVHSSANAADADATVNFVMPSSLAAGRLMTALLCRPRAIGTNYPLSSTRRALCRTNAGHSADAG
jgi:hypothetical protein